MLSRDQILSKTELKKEVVFVEEWGGKVLVSEMTGAARDAWEQAMIKRDEGGNLINLRAKLVIATVVDESGSLLFTNDDINEVSRLSGAALGLICQVARKLNGLGEEALEESQGNSEAGPSEGSASV